MITTGDIIALNGGSVKQILAKMGNILSRKLVLALYGGMYYHIGKEAVVLMEKSKVGTPMHGFTDNYVRVELPYDLSLDNQLVRVRLGDFNEDGTALMGTIV